LHPPEQGQTRPKITPVGRDIRSAAMDRGVAILITVIAGGLIALQAPINATLGKATGSLPAALISFLIGTIALALIVALAGQSGGVSSFADAGPVYLIGGLLGAVYVTCALIAVSSVGAGGVAAATITGQLVASVVIDRIGAFGLEESPLTLSRIAGVALLLGGTFLIVR
jgi:bacterial/archaeal transporter family-2 protein